MKLIAELSAQIPSQEKDGESTDVLLRVMTDPEDDQLLRLEIVENGKPSQQIIVEQSDLLEAVARLSGTAFSDAVPKQEAS